MLAPQALNNELAAGSGFSSGTIMMYSIVGSNNDGATDPGLILGLHPTNSRCRYKVTTSLIG